ncbi:MAG: hypothetical protein KAS39_03305, partial [Actinomycetia bacterium]|nr:hypothetical protein [Actinomycetes bacterium]
INGYVDYLCSDFNNNFIRKLIRIAKFVKDMKISVDTRDLENCLFFKGRVMISEIIESFGGRSSVDRERFTFVLNYIELCDLLKIDASKLREKISSYERTIADNRELWP